MEKQESNINLGNFFEEGSSISKELTPEEIAKIEEEKKIKAE